MPNVKPKKIKVEFWFKGVLYQPGDEPPTIPARLAELLVNNNFIELDKDAKEKVEKVATTSEKNSKAGPGK